MTINLCTNIAPFYLELISRKQVIVWQPTPLVMVATTVVVMIDGSQGCGERRSSGIDFWVKLKASFLQGLPGVCRSNLLLQW